MYKKLLLEIVLKEPTEKCLINLFYIMNLHKTMFKIFAEYLLQYLFLVLVHFPIH